MDPNQEIENTEELADEIETDETTSVDDFIRQLEEKEKDLHITAETTFIEIAEGFEDGELPDFMKDEFVFEGNSAVAPAVALAPEKSTDLDAELAALKAKVEKMEAERAEMFKHSRRRTKDFETYKLRTERERKETFQNQISNLATKMLPALDNLNRAVDFAVESIDDQPEDFRLFFEGIILVNQQVHDVFAGMGVEPIQAVGERFDPHFHEAVAIEESADLPPNTVSEVLLRGYKTGTHVIRHSMVKVTKSAGVDGNRDDLAEQSDLEKEEFLRMAEAEDSFDEAPGDIETGFDHLPDDDK